MNANEHYIVEYVTVNPGSPLYYVVEEHSRDIADVYSTRDYGEHAEALAKQHAAALNILVSRLPK